MLTSSHTQVLTKYFSQSGRFYYVIIDLQGNFVYVNPLFEQQFNPIDTDLYGRKATGFFPEADSDKFKQAMQECLQHKAVACQVDLLLPSVNDLNQITRWELSALLNEEGVVENIQGIGFRVDELGYTIPSLNHRIGEMTERYKAYEQSAEGLWKFELKIPIHQSPLPQELADHCRKYSFLTECNDTLARMYGFEKAEEFIGTVSADILNFSDGSRIEKLGKFIKSGFQSMLIETKEFDRFGHTKYFLTKMEGAVENGMLKRVWGTQQDITEQRLTEENNKYLASIVEAVSDVIISQDKDFNIVSWNKAAETIYGYSASDMIGRKINEVLNFEFQEISRPRFFEILHEKGFWQGEAHVVNKSGKHITILTAITKIQNTKEETTGYVSVSKDITEQKRLSKELFEQEVQKQKLLTQATIDGQEKERLQIGKELHDNISQHLTTTRLYMEVAKEKATGEVLEMINLSHKTLSDIINEIRYLSQSLVPPTLGDIGLIESVHDLCDSLKRAHKFNIDFYFRHFNEDLLPGNLKLMLFRIIQEQVNNIVRHAQANSIKIKLQSDAEYILLSISDDGVGFDPFNHKKGLGISNIGNRVGLFNGKVEIEAAPGKGCILSVIIPLDAGGE